MSELLWVPVKSGSDIDISKPLKNLISSTFSSNKDLRDETIPKLTTLQNLRQAAVRGGFDRSENALNAYSNYFDQLNSLEQKIPAHEVQIPFKWRDAFNRGSIFGGRITLTIPSLSYEKVATLFNVAALCSSVAADQSLESEEGQQKALKKLSLASGIFKELKETAAGALRQEPTPDLEAETLGVLSELMLAQAQEMVVLKAINDKMKDGIVAKLCAQADELYQIVLKSIQKEAVRGIWDSSWVPNVAGKQSIYCGLTHYFQAKVCNANKSIGEEIARLEHAKMLLQTGADRSKSSDLCKVKLWIQRTENQLKDAKKDNDFIYHERIPEVKSLPQINKAVVAKPAYPLPTKLGNQDAEDLFRDLCPVAVHQAVTTFEMKKNELVGREVNKMKEATNRINELLTSKNLPAAIEDTGNNELPASLKEKADKVKDGGGLAKVETLINDLPSLLVRNTEILDECQRILKEESDSDTALKTQFKDKWTRTPSAQLTGTFTTNAQKYRTIINNAKEADGVVRGKLDTHRKFIEMLSGGAASLQSAVPASSAVKVKGSPSVTKLKQLIEDVDTLKAEREVCESEIKTAKVDVQPLFFQALNKSGIINEPEISNEELQRVFEPLQKQANENLERQEKLEAEIITAHDQFSAENGTGSGNDREDMLKKLASAHDAFFELRGNLEEGTKFYNDLTQLLITFQNKVSDFCFARKTEKEELMKDLTSGMASMSVKDGAGATPAVPAYQQQQQPERPVRKTDPPARPPQPASNPYAGAPQPASTTAASAPSAPNPYAGAPAQAPQAPANPYAGAPGPMPMPQPYGYYPPPMPTGYNPYAPQPAAAGQQPPASGYPPAAGGYPPQGYPPQQPYPGYPPQGYAPYPPQPYPPQGQWPQQQPPQQQPPPQQ